MSVAARGALRMVGPAVVACGTRSPNLTACLLLARMDARRAAAWLGLATAFAAVWGHGSAAMATAALGTVAAVGDVPRLMGARGNLLWFAERAMWPLLGTLSGASCRWLAADGSCAASGAAMAAAFLTAITMWIVRRSGMSAADATSVTLLIAAAAVAMAEFGGSTVAAGALWGGLALCVAAAVRFVPAVIWDEDRLPRAAGDMVPGGMVSRGLVRRVLGRGAMIVMLAAMACWLVLDPERAALASLLGTTLMVCLAVPAALLEDNGGAAWARLTRSAARSFAEKGPSLAGRGAGAVGRKKLIATRVDEPLGPRRQSVEVAVRHAAVLGWPALVAAAVMAASSTGPSPGLRVAAGIAGVAAGVLVVGVCCFSCRASRETAHAVALVLVAVAAVLAAACS